MTEIKKKESPIIVLDETKKSRLIKKLDEYEKRLNEKKSKLSGFESPEQKALLLADTKYKIALARELLQNGEVNTWNLSDSLAKEDIFYTEPFEKACGVINDYMITGGAYTRKGTGF